MIDTPWRQEYTDNALLELGTKAINRVMETIAGELLTDRDRVLSASYDGKTDKRYLKLDESAEKVFRQTVKGKLPNLIFEGEERLKQRDFSVEVGHVVLCDAVDGTDLLERGLGNWCSAATFYNPSIRDPNQQLRVAVVGHSDGAIYCASMEKDKVAVFEKKKGRGASKAGWRDIRGPSRVKKLVDASVCFYGQKVSRLREFCRSGLLEWALANLPEKNNFRIYNLAGIPMVMRLIDPFCAESSTIDAVVEFAGQKPHDCLPAAFLAIKAGAAVTDLNGNPLSYEYFAKAAMHPSKADCRYIIAATQELAGELVTALSYGKQE
jgi:fructose-1,6-bisphosphatase/inositol monophosphatase family enzyme